MSDGLVLEKLFINFFANDLCVNSKRTEAFRIGEEAIKRVDDSLYLGYNIDENEGILLDIQQRENKARGAFSTL
jgi:hypothetical protein